MEVSEICAEQQEAFLASAVKWFGFYSSFFFFFAYGLVV
jgi:hypothetical protein